MSHKIYPRRGNGQFARKPNFSNVITVCTVCGRINPHNIPDYQGMPQWQPKPLTNCAKCGFDFGFDEHVASMVKAGWVRV